MSTCGKSRDIAPITILFSMAEGFWWKMVDIEELFTVWNTLRQMFQLMSQSIIDALLEQCQGLRMAEKETLLPYFNGFSVMETQLECIGHREEEKEKRRVLLKGLKNSFSVAAEIESGREQSLTEATAML